MNKKSQNQTTDKGHKVNDKEHKTYAERFKQESFKQQSNLIKRALFGNPEVKKFKCEKNVIDCAENYNLVKFMIGALKSAGCPIKFERHISCEYCTGNVNGGYDPKYNQVVICYNKTKNKQLLQGVLAHEFLHMYDNCKMELDFNNLEHIACTEIRAANLLHCSILGGVFNGSVSPLNIKKAHKNCVKYKAVESITATRNLSKKEAYEIVDKVFDRCYNDLEPFGRVLRNPKDIERIYRERLIYGYY